METKKIIYNENGIWSFYPSPKVDTEEIMIHKNGEVYEYCKTLIAFESFRNQLTSRGQTRKNALANKRRKLFNRFNEKTIDIYINFLNQIRLNKIRKLETKIVLIKYDGRKKNNLFSILQGVQMALNVGGMSPQYYDLGFRSYRLEK